MFGCKLGEEGSCSWLPVDLPPKCHDSVVMTQPVLIFQ